MEYQSVFKRYELKYLLTEEQKNKVLEAMRSHMQLDDYGRTTIRNVYFDTPDYRLIRHSIESPVYKEKLRVRSYCRADSSSTVFVELKKKYKKTVYKRRIAMPEQEATHWLLEGRHSGEESQIYEEIDYFMEYYKELRPAVFLSYEREAYYMPEDPTFRVTFDENILCRRDALSLQERPYGESILKKGESLMEIKCTGAIPIWMIRTLSEEHIYKTSFSKYGKAYKEMIFPGIKAEPHHEAEHEERKEAHCA